MASPHRLAAQHHRHLGRLGLTALTLLILTVAPAQAGFEDETDGSPGFFERLLGADKEELKGYADRLDTAMEGRVGQELDERGYGEEARSLWQRIKDWLFSDEGY